MTEEEWLTSYDRKPMRLYLIDTDQTRVQAVEELPDARGSGRKLRFFACACSQRSTVQVAERFADGIASAAELLKAEAADRELIADLESRWRASDGAERVALNPIPLNSK